MDLIQKEYEILRQEIEQKMSLHNTLLTFTITSTILVLTVAVSEEEPILYLFPFCIIIPMLLRIAYYKKALAKLSAYMIVFLEPKLEGINWETRNYSFSKDCGGLPSRKHRFKINYYEGLVLSCVCYILYLMNYLPSKLEKITAIITVGAIWPIIPLVWVVIITCKINGVDRDRESFICYWKSLKQREKSNHKKHTSL